MWDTPPKCWNQTQTQPRCLLMSDIISAREHHDPLLKLGKRGESLKVLDVFVTHIFTSYMHIILLIFMYIHSLYIYVYIYSIYSVYSCLNAYTFYCFSHYKKKYIYTYASIDTPSMFDSFLPQLPAASAIEKPGAAQAIEDEASRPP